MRTSSGVSARGLAKRFDDVDALADVSFEVPPGTVLGLLGPNGAGKSTTVRILATLIAPDGGSAQVAGHDVVEAPGDVRRCLGLTGQFAAVDEQLTGVENLVLFGRLRGLTKAAAVDRAAELLAMFELLDAEDQRVATYSGGMRRRLDLGVSLVVEPSVLVLDEPTTGLDPRSRFALWDVVRELRERGMTVLLTTQYLEEADQLADEIVVIDRGSVVAEGTAAQLKSRVGDTAVEVTVADLSRLDDVASIMAASGLVPATSLATASVTAAAPSGWATLAVVGEQVQRAGIDIDDIGLRRPSLDEVFLALTGHAASDEGDTATAGHRHEDR
jgi:ABC-2 type transport system ATP-binding protein